MGIKSVTVLRNTVTLLRNITTPPFRGVMLRYAVMK